MVFKPYATLQSNYQFVMFSENNAYYYQQPELELFERELPHKSIKIPLKQRERNQRILTQVQRKHQIEQLRTQVMEKCKFEELEYLQMLKKQREIMEEDIKRRKQLIHQHKMDLNIENNKKNRNQAIKIKDSLDQLERQEQYRYKPKTQRAESAYSSSISSFIGSRIITPSKLDKTNEDVMSLQVQNQVSKEDEVKKLKAELLNKYKFAGQDGKKPMKPSQREENTQIKWWINKVRKHREEQQKTENKGKESNSTVLSDTESDVSVK